MVPTRGICQGIQRDGMGSFPLGRGCSRNCFRMMNQGGGDSQHC